MGGPPPVRTNHLGLDLSSGRKAPSGVLYYAAAQPHKVFRPLHDAALRATDKLMPGLFLFDSVRHALNPMLRPTVAEEAAPMQEMPRRLQGLGSAHGAVISICIAAVDAARTQATSLRVTSRPEENHPSLQIQAAVAPLILEQIPPAFFQTNPTDQLRVMADGATVMLDAAETFAEIVALAAKMRRSVGDDSYFAAGGKPMNDGDGRTLGALRAGKEGMVELCRRRRGGMAPKPDRDALEKAFALFDTDGDGLLSPDELKKILVRGRAAEGGTASLSDERIERIVKEYDTNGDGKLSMDELAEAWSALQFSRWDELGASALKQALPCTKFPDARYLYELAMAGGTLPRCQDLKDEHCVTLEEMEKSAFNGYNILSALIISYPWLDADNPDVNGEQLRRVAPVLKIFADEAEKKAGGKCGVFWDYCSCAAARVEPRPTPRPLHIGRPPSRRLPQRSMEAHRKGRESAAAARAAAEAAGEDQAAQDQAAKEAFNREDDRTPEELETFKQVRVASLCR